MLRNKAEAAGGETLTILDVDGPGRLSHIWFTLNAAKSYQCKRIVLRMYWDGDTTPSVETPIGDFFGLGTGQYYLWSSPVLSIGSDRSLNRTGQMIGRQRCFMNIPSATERRQHAGPESCRSLNWLQESV